MACSFGYFFIIFALSFVDASSSSAITVVACSRTCRPETRVRIWKPATPPRATKRKGAASHPREGEEKVDVADEDVCGLRPAIFLAKEVGAGLERRQILLGSLPHRSLRR